MREASDPVNRAVQDAAAVVVDFAANLERLEALESAEEPHGTTLTGGIDPHGIDAARDAEVRRRDVAASIYWERRSAPAGRSTRAGRSEAGEDCRQSAR